MEERGGWQRATEQRDDLLGATLMFNHKRIARLSVDKKRGFSILRDSQQGAERRKVLTMSSRHILFYVFEVERHEGINPVVRLDKAVFRKPRPP